LPPGYQLFGTDYANFNVRVASRRLRGKAEITRASIYELPYADCSFDVGICLEVIEHIEHDEPAAREIARVLKPGGILIASVPYTYYWPQYLKLMGHFRHYTRQSFANLLGNCGLSVVDYLPNYPIWHQAYTRRYAMVRAEVETIGRLTGQRDLYSFKWPWSREPSLTRLAHRLEPLRLRDASLDYATRPTSTFLVVRKQSADASAKLGAA